MTKKVFLFLVSVKPLEHFSSSITAQNDLLSFWKSKQSEYMSVFNYIIYFSIMLTSLSIYLKVFIQQLISNSLQNDYNMMNIYIVSRES